MSEILADPVARFGLGFILCSCGGAAIGGVIFISRYKHPLVGMFLGGVIGGVVGVVAGIIFARVG